MRGAPPRTPRVVNRRVEPGGIYVGRPSPLGNPFRIGRDGTREEVIEKYRAWLPSRPDLVRLAKRYKGQDLACWCAPLLCHADVILEVANAD